MNIEKGEHDKTYYLNITENCFTHLINDWEQLFGKWNWYSFHFIHIYFEKDDMAGGYEFEFIMAKQSSAPFAFLAGQAVPSL